MMKADVRWQEVVATGTIWLVVLGILGILLWILADVFWQGAQGISWQFLTSNPINAGREGGILPIFISTALILGVCLVVSVPLGVGTAILLTEFVKPGSWFGYGVGMSLDILGHSRWCLACLAMSFLLRFWDWDCLFCLAD